MASSGKSSGTSGTVAELLTVRQLMFRTRMTHHLQGKFADRLPQIICAVVGLFRACFRGASATGGRDSDPRPDRVCHVLALKSAHKLSGLNLTSEVTDFQSRLWSLMILNRCRIVWRDFAPRTYHSDCTLDP